MGIQTSRREETVESQFGAGCAFLVFATIQMGYADARYGNGCAATLRMVDPNVAFTAVRASHDKIGRKGGGALPAGPVHHIGTFPQLEDQRRCELDDSRAPRPGPKEVLMRVRASSLNYRDLMVLKGGGRGPTKLGVVLLSDDAGEVAAIGEGVSRAKIGDP
jgi:hypothetical protein